MTIPCRAKRTLIAGLALAAGCLTTAPALAAAPANDDFANAASLGTAKALATPYTLDEATGQVFEQHPQGGLGNSIWYSWTAPTDGHVQVLACTANGTIYDRASVYEGTQLSALVWQSSVGPALCGAGSTFQAWQGHTYRIQVEGNYGFPHVGTGPLQLDLRTTPSATISLPAKITSDADGSGNAKPSGLTFYGFDWSVQPAQGECTIDGSLNLHIKYCYAGSLAWTGLSVGDHTLKFRAMDPWGFWSNQVTSTITVPAPTPQSPVTPRHPGRAVRSGHDARPAGHAVDPSAPPARSSRAGARLLRQAGAEGVDQAQPAHAAPPRRPRDVRGQQHLPADVHGHRRRAQGHAGVQEGRQERVGGHDQALARRPEAAARPPRRPPEGHRDQRRLGPHLDHGPRDGVSRRAKCSYSLNNTDWRSSS